MGKWDILNKEFDDVLDNLTKEDWIKWDNSRIQLKEKRQSELLKQALVQEQCIVLDNTELIPLTRYLFDYNELQNSELLKSPINSGIFFVL